MAGDLRAAMNSRCHRTVADVGDSKTMEKGRVDWLRGFVSRLPVNHLHRPASRYPFAPATRLHHRADKVLDTGKAQATNLGWRNMERPDCSRTALYGRFVQFSNPSGKRTDAYIDLPHLKALMTRCRRPFVSGEFNGVFDSALAP